MNDMRAVIVPKSDQLNADDLLGGPITITITRVVIKPGTEQPVSMNYEGDNGKPYKPCKSMCRVMVSLWGPDANQYVGRSMTIFSDPKVLWGGMAVGGIRISHMSHIEGSSTMALTATKGSKKPFTVQPLRMDALATSDSSVAEDKVAKWLTSLDRKLTACTSVDQVLAVKNTSQVQANLSEQSPEEFKAKINALFKVALDRVDVPIGDDAGDEVEDDFPGDRVAD